MADKVKTSTKKTTGQNRSQNGGPPGPPDLKKAVQKGLPSGRPSGLLKGRLKEPMDKALAKASVSVGYDARLAHIDLRGSLAHAAVLREANLLTPGEFEKIREGLGALSADPALISRDWDENLEDIHMNLEKALTDLIGEAGAKIHTARSRNDQVAFDERLYLMEVTQRVRANLFELRSALVKRAKEAGLAPMPGYTHLQRAQPVLLAHHLMAHYQVLTRDEARLKGFWDRGFDMPLGSGALSGTGLPVDVTKIAENLPMPFGLSPMAFGPSLNSLDAVASRDLLLEFLSYAAIISVNLSRMAEEIVLWTGSEFSFAALPDSLSTTSSMMPQKKNPDGAELIRGKTGRTIGNLVALLTTVKGLPLAYNRDLQEDKEPLFDSVDTLDLVLPLMAAMVKGLNFNYDRLREAADDPYVGATDLADHLVLKGLPFRKAHEAVGSLVTHLAAQNTPLRQVDAKTLKAFCPLADPDFPKTLTVDALIAARQNAPGGTAWASVKGRLEEAQKKLAEEAKFFSGRKRP
ncbi:MAG: argininosuccinate lyase [Deltaproteobacteria bacterium]|jgi:argininosuccinate lyase|nr:argininosuccinate lyase [Deltaproteobacteria bacterium]